MPESTPNIDTNELSGNAQIKNFSVNASVNCDEGDSNNHLASQAIVKEKMQKMEHEIQNLAGQSSVLGDTYHQFTALQRIKRP